MNEKDVNFLIDLVSRLKSQASTEGQVLYHVVQLKTSMTPDFSGVVTVENTIGAVFLTRPAAEAFISILLAQKEHEGVKLEIRPLPSHLSPEIAKLLEVVQNMIPGI